MWEISLSDQLLTFLCGIALGIIMCVYYDVIRAVLISRKSGKIIIFLGDLFFCITSAFAVFLFLLSRTNGELRGYVFISIGIGFLFFKLTLSKILMLILKVVFIHYYKLLGFIGGIFLKIIDLLASLLKRMEKMFQKSLKWIKKLLKKGYQLLYTMIYSKHKENNADESQKAA